MRNWDWPPTNPRLKAWLSYGLAAGATAAAGAVRWALDPLLGQAQPFPIFYLAILLVTFWLGWRPGLVAAVLGFLVGDWFFLSPRRSFNIVTADGAAHTLAYFLLAGVILFCLEWSKRSAKALAAAHESLRQSEERLRATFHKAAVGIVEVDCRDRFTAVNERVCQILGYRPEELLGKTVHEITAAEDRARSDQLNAELREGQRERIEYEKRYLKGDGSPLWVHVTASVVRDGPGPTLRFIGTVEDISERKQAEAALREQARLAQLRADATQALQQPGSLQRLLQQVAGLLVERLEAALARVWTLDPEGRTLELQASAGLYTHLDGRHSRVPVEGALKIGRIAEQQRALVSNQVVGDPQIPEQEWARREGLVAFAGFPLVLEGQLLGVVALFARHTLSPAAVKALEAVAGNLAQALGRKQVEAALQHSREELARANAELERKVQERTAKLRESVEELEGFSYSLVHDLRGPLRAMQSFAGLAQQAQASGEPAELLDYLQRIRRASNRMDQLVTDALNYSRVVLAQLRLAPVELAGLVRGLLESYPQLQAPAAHIRVEFTRLVVWGNEAALTQVFSNLLSNAVKFVAPGVTPCVRVQVEARHLERRRGGAAEREQPRYVRIWVEDNGVGLPQGAEKKIFAMFQRMHQAEEYPGTGIGLAIVRKAMERMGGRVGVESEPGKGSRFWVELREAAGGLSDPGEALNY